MQGKQGAQGLYFVGLVSGPWVCLPAVALLVPFYGSVGMVP